MTEQLMLELLEKRLTAEAVVLHVGYDKENCENGDNSTRKILIEYDAGLIPYESTFRILQQCAKSVNWCDGNEYEATACMYDRCGRCLRKGLPMFKLGVLYNNQEVLNLVRKETIDYHLCQDCIDKLGIQEFIDSSWNVEEQARYDYHG